MFIYSNGQPANGKQYVDDVFSAYTYTGNGSTQTITNGIDLAGKGGLVWCKLRNGSSNHMLCDTTRGATKLLSSDYNGAQDTQATSLTSFNSNGFSLGAYAPMNSAVYPPVISWTFRNANKFFTHTTKAHTNGTADTIDLSSLGTVGMVWVKGIVTGGDNWKVFHRSATSGKLLYLNLTNAETTDASISISGTTLTLAASLPSDTYVIYAWAHDSSADGIIQCGSFTTDGSSNATVSLGWEPQLVDIKASSTTDQWYRADASRGMCAGGADNLLYLNQMWSESGGILVSPTATGFVITGRAPSSTFIYLAIRRPNKPPTSGTQVYNAAISQVGKVPAYDAGWPIDVALRKDKTGSNTFVWSRLTGGSSYLTQNLVIDETSWGSDVGKFDSMTSWFNQDENNTNFVSWMFRRAPGVYDQICHKGSGNNKTEPHTLLGVAPELWRTKRRDDSGYWTYGSSLLAATEKIVMPSPNGRVTDATAWNSTYPTASQFSFGTLVHVNASGGTYITEMWATKPGISKVGKYTGNGGSQNIECGFTSGARFVMVISLTTGVAQDIFVFDTVRGIVAANDPHLSLNTTAAEVTTDDSIDPYNSGFIVNQNTATNINISGYDYLYLAFA